MSWRHTFAKKWLYKLGNKIFDSRGQQLLSFTGDMSFPFYPLNTRLKITEHVEADEPESEEEAEMQYRYISYADLLELGYVVVSIDVRDRWAKGQLKYYKIARKKSTVPGIGLEATNKAVYIQHDALRRRVRLLNKAGKVYGIGTLTSGVTEWTYYGPETNNVLETYDAYNPPETKKDEYTYISELPVLRTEEGYILCLPKENPDQSSPVPRILVVGLPGMGKTFCLVSIASRIPYKFQDRCIWIIDPLDQFFNIMLPQPNENMIKQLQEIGEEPRPLPVVLFYMASNLLEESKMQHVEDGVSFKLTVDFQEFMENYDFFTDGLGVEINKKYLDDCKTEFIGCTNAQEIKDALELHLQNEGVDTTKQSFNSMMYKYKNSFNTIFSFRFTSNLYLEDPLAQNKWSVQFKNGTVIETHPFIACYEAGLIPILNVAHCRDEPWLRNALARLLQKILFYQIAKGKDNQKRLWIIADEMNSITEKGGRTDALKTMFERLYRQGRLNHMGFLGNTQSYAKLDEEQRKYATHLFCVRITDSKERRAIGENLKLSREVYDQLENLRKFEIMAISREPWVIYDKFGRKVTDEKVLSKRYWRGTVIPPVCYNYTPQKKQKGQDEVDNNV